MKIFPVSIVILAVLSIIAIILLMVTKKNKENFSDFRRGTYLNYLMKQTWPAYFDKKAATVSNGVIRMPFPKGSCGKDKLKNCGISAVALYPSNFDNKKATLSAKILFEPGFAFDQGKLGLGFEMGAAGATGGHGSATASSCRVIFRNGGAASCYIYVPLKSKQSDPDLKAFADGKSQYGKEFFLGDFPAGTFKVGVKNSVSIGVKMNTPGRVNGECFMTINGKTARKRGIMWLTSNVAQGITRINHTTFIGGSHYSSKDQWLQMSNLKLTPKYPLFKA